jgi:hypothetical protein
MSKRSILGDCGMRVRLDFATFVTPAGRQPEIALETPDRIGITPVGVTNVAKSKRTHNGSKYLFCSSRRT